jgi:hypothetical protein
MKNVPSPQSDSEGTDYPITLGSTWARNSESETWSLRYERKSLSAAVPSNKSSESSRRGNLELEAGNASSVALHWDSARGENFSGFISGANPIDCVLIYNPELKAYELQRLSKLVTSLRPASAAAPRGIKPATSLAAAAAAAARKRKIGSETGSVARSPLGGAEPPTTKMERARGKMTDLVTDLHAILNTSLPVTTAEVDTRCSVAETKEEKVTGGKFKKPRGRAPVGKAWNSFTGLWFQADIRYERT